MECGRNLMVNNGDGFVRERGVIRRVSGEVIVFVIYY